ncbi:hypothetical protein GUN87_004529 [Salmonella enterica]|nr:hypothetical protein [Salmonella enterica]
MKPRKPKICKVCGSEFVPYRSYQKVCGTQCAAVHARREQEKKKAKAQADKLVVRYRERGVKTERGLNPDYTTWTVSAFLPTSSKPARPDNRWRNRVWG